MIRTIQLSFRHPDLSEEILDLLNVRQEIPSANFMHMYYVKITFCLTWKIHIKEWQQQYNESLNIQTSPEDH